MGDVTQLIKSSCLQQLNPRDHTMPYDLGLTVTCCKAKSTETCCDRSEAHPRASLHITGGPVPKLLRSALFVSSNSLWVTSGIQSGTHHRVLWIAHGGTVRAFLQPSSLTLNHWLDLSRRAVCLTNSRCSTTLYTGKSTPTKQIGRAHV